MEEILHPNQAVWLSVEQESHRSQVAEVDEDAFWVLTPWPPHQAPAGTLVRVVFHDALGFAHFDAPVTGYLDGQVRLMGLERPVSVVRDQRRDHVRVACRIKVELAVLPETEATAAEPGVALDISGGGMHLAGPAVARLKPGTRLKLGFSLPDATRVDTEAEVMQVYYDDAGRRESVGVHFTDLPRRLEDRIVAFVFETQRQLRRQGLL